MITAQDRNHIRRLFRKIEAEIAPLIDRKKKQGTAHESLATDDMMAAQNTLRVCMEVVFEVCTPFNEWFVGELAVRMAAYAVSIAPIERHDAIVEAVCAALPGALANKRRENAVLHATWETGGVEHPNLPAKGSLQ